MFDFKELRLVGNDRSGSHECRCKDFILLAHFVLTAARKVTVDGVNLRRSADVKRIPAIHRRVHSVRDCQVGSILYASESLHKTFILQQALLLGVRWGACEFVLYGLLHVGSFG